MMDKEKIIVKYEGILSKIYRLFGHNRCHIARNNTIDYGNAFMKRCSINILGSGNRIKIEGSLTRLTDCNITIRHSNSTITINSRSNLNHCNLYIEDNNGEIVIGRHVTITGATNIAVIEGKSIIIGDDCLFSSDISFRTGDSHSIINIYSNKRINPSKDINIGNHVWIGQGVKILKGTNISDNSIVATGSIVTENTFPKNSVIGGVPAKILKQGVTWNPHRLPME